MTIPQIIAGCLNKNYFLSVAFPKQLIGRKEVDLNVRQVKKGYRKKRMNRRKERIVAREKSAKASCQSHLHGKKRRMCTVSQGVCML